MGDIFVIAENRGDELRDITFQMLFKASELCEKYSHRLTAVIMCDDDGALLQKISDRADRIISVKDKRLKSFSADLQRDILDDLIKKYRPLLTLIGHTPWGMDLAPVLSIKTGLPMASDCVDIEFREGNLKAIRQIYSGKLFSRVAFEQSDGYILTVRPGVFSTDKNKDCQAEILNHEIPHDIIDSRTEFIDFMESVSGDIDITQADFLVSVGRGIGEEENVALIRELAESMGAVLSCSRPIVDKNWLPKFHQVGTSGKSVKPKVYLAFGISGAFQHVAGLGGADTIIAVNKDKKAPIFRVADYGIAEDLFKIIDSMKNQIN